MNTIAPPALRVLIVDDEDLARLRLRSLLGDCLQPPAEVVGECATAPAALQWLTQHPVDVAGRLNGPVLGLYGGQDTGIPLDTVEKMKAALAQGSPAARASSFVVYPDAPHAFHADYRPSYRKEDAEDGWRRMLAWFRQHGV